MFIKNKYNKIFSVPDDIGKKLLLKESFSLAEEVKEEKKIELPKETIADIIIPHYDRHDLLKNVLDKLPIDLFNIIVISGGTFAENCNKGAKLAKTDNLIFMNDDIEPDIELLIESCKREENIIGFTESIKGKIHKGIGLREEQREDFLPTIKKENDILLPLGFLFRIKKKVWKDLKGFDEQFKNGAEDIDLFLRAKEKEYTFGYLDKPVEHICGASIGRMNYSQENKDKFWKKWDEEKIKKALGVKELYSKWFIKEPVEEEVDVVFIETIPGESEEAVKMVKENTKHPHRITIYDNTKKKSKNLTKTWNKLIKESKCKYVCLINTDAFVTEGWLTEMMKGFQKENALLVTPCGDKVFGKQSTDILQENKFESLDYFSGFCFIVDKDKIKKVDYFDEDVTFYGNEKVFAVKVRKTKYLMIWSRGAFVSHHNESTVKELGLYEEMIELGFKEKVKWYTKNSPVLFLTCNRLEYTKKAYKSLVESEVQNIIIIDNASTDGTKSWLKRLRNKKIKKIVFNKENLGVAGAMTQFFEMTKGERYVGKVDNDTIVPKNWFSFQIDKCERYGVDIIQPKHKIFNLQYKTFDEWMNALPKYADMRINSFVGGSAIVVKREKINDKIETLSGNLSGWTEYQKRHNNLKKAFTDEIEIDLLDMNGDNDYKYEKFTDYYENYGRLKERNLKYNQVFTICGLPGGGTSAISNIFYQLGLPMDNGKYVENHNEDLEMREAIMKDNWEKFKKLVKERNKKYKRWGWKYPTSWEKLDKIKEIIPNLKIVYVVRDPWASSETLVRRNIKYRRSLFKTSKDYLQTKLSDLTRLCQVILEEKNPNIVVSYEKVIRDTEEQVKRIADFLQLEHPDIKSAIEVIGISDEYKNL